MESAQTSTATIEISTGVLAGTVTVSNTQRIRRFLAIPYAEPPVGDRRFADPVPVGPWDGVRDASAHGPTAPQDPYPGAIGELLTSVEIPGDDVLTVNVWTPAEQSATGSPVALWIHGGAFERGTAALSAYDGTTFAREGVVYVSVNYRLGAEGFGVLDDAPLNLGLRDVALALKWVAREIAAFGGDPRRITVMGESAGAALVAALLVRPDTAPLIAGAIIQSGPLVAETRARSSRATAALAKALKVPATRAGFGAKTPKELVAARGAITAGSSPLRGAAGFTLALDPDSLPASPHEALAGVDIPILIGANTDEYRLWFTPASLAKISRLHLALARRAFGVSRSALKQYRDTWPEASPGELFGQLATDVLMRAPGIRAARSRHAPTFVYEFAWRSPRRDLRAAHAMEIAFVFDHVGKEDAILMTGEDAPQALADQMHADWVRFITTGDPGWAPFNSTATPSPESIRRYDVDSGDVPLPRSAVLEGLPREKVR